MKRSDPRARRWIKSALLTMAAVATVGCHGSGDWEPLSSQKIYVSDRFYDLATLGEKSALVVGYNGKVLKTADAGVTWEVIDSGSPNALYSVGFVDEKIGWIVGQEAEILRTEDGGNTWAKQAGDIYMTDECRAPDREEDCALAPLFSLSVIDANNAVAIGDRSLITVTKDGGKTWSSSTLEPEGLDQMDLNTLLAFEDPVLYDVHFFDPTNGFVVGEFGKIYKTIDGGEHWIEKQKTLVGSQYFDVLDLPTFFDVEFSDRNNGYVVGLEGRVAHTTDGGETWAWVEHGVAEYDAPFYASEILPNGDLWVVGAGGQVVSALDGNPLSQGTLGTAVNNWIRRITFHDDNNGWAVGGFGFIMNTNDGGATWFRRIG